MFKIFSHQYHAGPNQWGQMLLRVGRELAVSNLPGELSPNTSLAVSCMDCKNLEGFVLLCFVFLLETHRSQGRTSKHEMFEHRRCTSRTGRRRPACTRGSLAKPILIREYSPSIPLQPSQPGGRRQFSRLAFISLHQDFCNVTAGPRPFASLATCLCTVVVSCARHRCGTSSPRPGRRTQAS